MFGEKEKRREMEDIKANLTEKNAEIESLLIEKNKAKEYVRNIT